MVTEALGEALLVIARFCWPEGNWKLRKSMFVSGVFAIDERTSGTTQIIFTESGLPVIASEERNTFQAGNYHCIAAAEKIVFERGLDAAYEQALRKVCGRVATATLEDRVKALSVVAGGA